MEGMRPMSDRNDVSRDTRAGSVRIAGFPVHASPTVLILFGLVAYTTALGLLPSAVPGASSAAYWAGGIVAAGLLLASLLVHELAHAIVARRHGITVEAVTFWLFGGIARMGGQAPTPRAEWRIAAIGPVTNLALAAVGFGVGQALSAVSAPELTIAVAGYFAGINLLLGVFNLLPAAPLDGGRVLRAVLWRRSGDHDRATVAAAKTGQAIAALIIVVGIVELSAASAIGGIWTTLIGWFLFSSARAEARQTSTQVALAGLRVRDLLPPPQVEPPPAAPAWHTVAAFLDAYRQSGDTRTVLPLRGFDGGPAGLVALGQLGAVPLEQRDVTRVGAVAAPMEHIVVTDPDEQLVDLVQRLVPNTRNLAAARLAGHALVVRDGQPVGVVTPADLARAMQLAKLIGPRPPSPPPAPPSSDAAPPRPTVAA